MTRQFIVWNHDIKPGHKDLVGQRNINLKSIQDQEIPVPYGFYVTSEAYKYFIQHNQFDAQIKEALLNIFQEDVDSINQASAHITSLIKNAQLPEELEKDITDAYTKLTNECQYCTLSNAIVSRLPDHAFAGQAGPYANVSQPAQLIEKIKESWASLYEPNSIFLAAENDYSISELESVIQVSQMINADSSGIMFTASPHASDSQSVVIESIHGLSLPLLHAQIAPDHFELQRNTHVILHKVINPQTHYLIAGHTKLKPLPHQLYNLPSLSDSNLKRLAKLGQKIHKNFQNPQEVEWAIADNQIYILNTKDIKTIPQLKKKHKLHQQNTTPLFSGVPASPGAVTGTAKIIHSPDDFTKLKPGDILITSNITVDHVYHLRRAAAVVTDHGGQTSHAAILGRELGIPCIVGTRIATKQLKNNQVITVDANQGKVYADKLNLAPTPLELPPGVTHIKQIKTKTKLFVNLSEPDIAPAVAEKHVDGVGLLRSEFIVSEYIGIHPRQLLFQNKKSIYIKKLAEGITQVCKAFKNKPVFYRTTDFTSNEYHQLEGGFRYETTEANPLIGLRGVARYLQDPNVFLLELEAFKRVRAKGYTNLHLMLPFVQTIDQLKDIKKLMYHHGIKRTPNLFMYMAIEVPSNVILLEDFIKVGLDGISIGSNDLTMLILGADRNNEAISHVYNEEDPAMLAVMEKIIKTAKKHEIACSICGQAPSNNSELVQKLVKWGITSISVSPDVIDQTRLAIKRNETNISKNKHRYKKKRS